jgi:phage host-nuclease inhibitor protein Gam
MYEKQARQASDLICKFAALENDFKEMQRLAINENDLDAAQQILEQFNSNLEVYKNEFDELAQPLSERLTELDRAHTQHFTQFDKVKTLDIERLKGKGKEKFNTDYVVVLPALQARFYAYIQTFQDAPELQQFYKELQEQELDAIAFEALRNVLLGSNGEYSMMLNVVAASIINELNETPERKAQLKAIQSERKRLENILSPLRKARLSIVDKTKRLPDFFVNTSVEKKKYISPVGHYRTEPVIPYN